MRPSKTKAVASRSWAVALLAIASVSTNEVHAQDDAAKASSPEAQVAPAEPKEAPSPWLLLPTLSTNYQIVGQTALDDDLISFLGLQGFEASGLGLVGQHDSRDRTDSPTQGWLLNFNNIAYRPKAEGSDNFSVYRLDYRQFWSH